MKYTFPDCVRPGSQNMSLKDSIEIHPFLAENQCKVKELILDGLAEHWGFIDPARNPDLNDIAASYADAIFLIAWRHERIVGAGALVPKSPEVAEIVRMSVAKDMRRKGIGRLILQKLCEQGKAGGYSRLILETTGAWQDVIDFYLNFGFEITHYRDGDVYFALDLAADL